MKAYVVQRKGMNAQFEIEAESAEEAVIKAYDVSLYVKENEKTFGITGGEIKVYDKPSNPLAPLIPAKE
tara:strand:+ start:507 stop:713 length:207 start_codon:yes stop_codon:yes gene_type:complete